MGLDIYLYKSADRGESQRFYESEKDLAHDAIYKSLVASGKYKIEALSSDPNASNALPDGFWDEYTALCKVWDDENPDVSLGEDEVRNKSTLYPEHMFKVGYLRSSYNDGGINSKLRALLEENKDLYYIFGHPDKEDYAFVPNWEESLVRAKEVLKEFRKVADAGFEVHKFSPNIFRDPNTLPKSPNEAMAIFKAQYAKHIESPSMFGGDYGNRDGDFMMGHPMTVVAVIPGIRESIAAKLYGKEDIDPVTYVITRANKEKLDWYVQALEIVVETCEYVLAQPDKDQYYFHWSA